MSVLRKVTGSLRSWTSVGRSWSMLSNCAHRVAPSGRPPAYCIKLGYVAVKYLTHYLASLGEVARSGIYEHISLSRRQSVVVQLRGSDHALFGDWLPGPKPFSRLVSICLEQSLRSTTRGRGVSVLVHAEVAAKNVQIDAKSPAHLSLVEKGDTKDTSLIVLTNKQCVLRAGTEVGKRLSRSSKRQFS